MESEARCSPRQFRKSTRPSERSMQFSETGENPDNMLIQSISFRQYDSLDPNDKSFLKDYRKFNSKVWMLDRKLSAILTRLASLPFSTSISRAFDDCAVTESIFKLLHIFGNLVQRNLIALELSDKMPLLIVTLDKEMDDARKIFMKQQVLKPLHEDLPGFIYLILSSV